MPVIPQPFTGSGQNPLVPPPPGSGVVPTPIGSGGSPLDLTTVQYATQVLAAGGVTLATAQAALTPSLITAASREIIRYTGNRLFPLTTWTEVLVPEGGRPDRGEPASAKTSQFPIQTVVSVMTGRAPALVVLNVDPATNQTAQAVFTLAGDVEFGNLTPTGLTLSRTASGAKIVDSLAFSTHPTVNDLAAAINGLGGGWRADAVACGAPNLGLFPSSALVGAREPRNAFAPGARLDVFSTPASAFDLDRATGILRCYGDGGGSWDGAWDGVHGEGAYQVTYQAGWPVVPANLQLVCAELVKLSYERLNLDANLKSESADRYSWTARDALQRLPGWATQILNYYKDWSV